MAFLFLVVPYIMMLLFLPMVIRMIVMAGFVRPNFRKENIPVAVGFSFALVSTLTILVLYPFVNMNRDSLFSFLFAVYALTLLGLLDDFLGSRVASGLKGHFRKLYREKELTTGALKALAGGLVSLLLAVTMQGLHNLHDLGVIILNALIIAFSTNAVNLLDLRPGRAGKAFILGAVILTLAGFGNPHLIYLYILVGCVLAYLPFDLRAKVMMGDTGSNVLGVTLGLAAVWVLGYQVKLGYLTFLILFHLFTEKFSLTEIIEKNPVLRYLDMMGRR